MMILQNRQIRSVLPKAVLELKDLRNEYKKKMKEATTKDEYIKWNNNQLAVKRLDLHLSTVLLRIRDLVGPMLI